MILRSDATIVPLGGGLYAMRHLVFDDHNRIVECFKHAYEADHYINQKKEELTRDG